MEEFILKRAIALSVQNAAPGVICKGSRRPGNVMKEQSDTYI
jgi:hypothetical protein